MRKNFTFLGFYLWSYFLCAQAPNHVPGELLLQLQPNSDVTLWVQGMYILRLRWGGEEIVAQKMLKM